MSNRSSNTTSNPVLFDSASFLDTTKPNLARVFDYFAGGSTHFEADRIAASYMLAEFPAIKKWVQLREAFSFEAIQVLHDNGFSQFLDLGSGMPSKDAVHQLIPNSTFIYSDININ